MLCSLAVYETALVKIGSKVKHCPILFLHKMTISFWVIVNGGQKKTAQTPTLVSGSYQHSTFHRGPGKPHEVKVLQLCLCFLTCALHVLGNPSFIYSSLIDFWSSLVVYMCLLLGFKCLPSTVALSLALTPNPSQIRLKAHTNKHLTAGGSYGVQLELCE